MGQADYLKLGDSNGLCMQCGFKFKVSQLILRWDGIWVDRKCWEPRQPQDFVRGIKDTQVPAVKSPEPVDQFVPGAGCTLEGRTAFAGMSVAGCWISGRTLL